MSAEEFDFIEGMGASTAGYRPFWEAVVKSGIYATQDQEDPEFAPDLSFDPRVFPITPPHGLEDAVEQLIEERGRNEITPQWFEDVEYLARRGYRSPAFNRLLADVVAGRVKRPRGRPKSGLGANARKTQAMILKGRVKQLQAQGMDHYEAREALAERLNISKRTLDTRVAEEQTKPKAR